MIKKLLNKNVLFSSYYLINFFVSLNLLFLFNSFIDLNILNNQTFFQLINSLFNITNLFSTILIVSTILALLIKFLVFVINNMIENQITIFSFSLLISFIFYFIGINSLSRRILIIFFALIIFEMFLSKKILIIFTVFKILMIFYLHFSGFSQITFLNTNSNLETPISDNNLIDNNYEFKEQISIEENFNLDEIQKCVNTFSNDVKNLINEYYIIGHSYGGVANSNSGLSENILSYFKSPKKNLILTGDIVRKNNIENLSQVKEEVFNIFENVYIAVGNHDLSLEYYQVFEDDLYLINEKNVDLIIANFSTDNWKPGLKDQVKINNFINNSANKNIIIFSHQIFWYGLTNKVIIPNGFHLLDQELYENNLSWLHVNDKNLIVISGDYGQESDNLFCEYQEKLNAVFIANGINSLPNDRILKLNIGIEGFKFEIINLFNE